MSLAVLITCDTPRCDHLTIVEGTRSTVSALGRAIRDGWAQDLTTGAVTCPDHAPPTAHDDLTERNQCARCENGDHTFCSRSDCTCQCRDRGTGRLPRIPTATTGGAPW